MCGIIGYSGTELVKPILIGGLKKLEYRGYDSAGLAMYCQDDFTIVRSVGQVSNLEVQSAANNKGETQGIAHTRWATHGVPNELNAHPHRTGATVLVHNGIIENHSALKEVLLQQGMKFHSQTDTEVFAWVIETERLAGVKASGREFSALDLTEKLDLVRQAARRASERVDGHYAVVFMVLGLPGYLFALQDGAPLVAAHKDTGSILASDIQAVLPHTQSVSFVPVGTYVQVSPTEIKFYRIADDVEIIIPSEKMNWSPEQVEKDGYESFMLKEIHQQPGVVADTLSGRLPRSENEHILWDDLETHLAFWKDAKRIVLVACGTAFYAAQTAKYYFEKWAQIPVEVDLASEFRYRSPVLSAGTVVGVISQSGETADTLSALRLANESGVPTFSVCNVPGSTISREAKRLYLTKAGPEIGVASTKAFTTQLTLLSLLACDLGLRSGKLKRMPELARLPHELSRVLESSAEFMKAGAMLKSRKTVLFIGRGSMYPIALEGALKLKEITYRHAEGYAAGELKHGPIALVDKDLACIVLAPSNELFAKTLSNIEEIKSRGGYIIGVGDADNAELKKLCDQVIGLPKCDWASEPMLYVMPLQLIAYGLAKELGCNIDKPRNLAKSVTVE